MVQRVQLPNGAIGEFPDTMSGAQIEAVLRKQFPPPSRAADKIDPSEGMSPWEKLAVGAGAAVARAGEGIGSLLGMDTSGLKADREVYEQHHPGGWSTAGEVLGDVALTALPTAGLIKGASAAGRAATAGRALPKALEAAGRAGATLGANAAVGAAVAPENRLAGAVSSAAGAGLGTGIQRALGGAVKPLVSDDAAALMRQGVQPTVGQSLGGMAGKLEEKLQSVPILGDTIAHARNRAQREWNEALVGKVAQSAQGHPVGVVGQGVRDAARAVGGSGDDALLTLRQQIGQVYEDVLSRVPEIHLDTGRIGAAALQIADDAGLALSDASKNRLLAYVEKNLTGRTGPLTGQAAKRIESDLGKAANTYLTSATGEERSFGEALQRLHVMWRESLEGTLPPAAQEALMGANAAWRGLLQLDKAGAYASSQQRGGQFTPRVLRQALAHLDKSQNDNALRRAMRLPVEQAESSVPYDYIASMARAGRGLGDEVPTSGTVERLGAAALGAGALAGGLPGSIPAGIAIGAGALGSTRIGQKLLTQGVAAPVVEKFLRWLAAKGIPEEQALNAFPMFMAAQQRNQPQADSALRQALAAQPPR